MIGINKYIQRKISVLYIILIPVSFLLIKGTYNEGFAVIKFSLILALLAAFNYSMSKIEKVKALNLMYGILYAILFIGIISSVLLCDTFGREHLAICSVLIFSIVAPFVVCWYLKKRKGIFISIFVLSFNFLVMIIPLFLLLLVRMLYH